MLDFLLSTMQNHHARIFPSRQRPLRNQLLRQIVIVISQPRAHTSASKQLRARAKFGKCGHGTVPFRARYRAERAGTNARVERPPRASRDALRQLWSEQPNKEQLLAPLRERVRACIRCPHLASSRTQTVFGVGNADADLMFIGEAPGADEDAQGEPFVGRAGQLLTRIIETMGFTRADVYIANVLKCRPDMPKGSFGNRAPTLSEMQTCLPYLVEQIEIIRPESARRTRRRRG